MEQHCCTECEKVLKDEKSTVWLELSLTDGLYYEELPTGHESQGAFPFGKSCAKTLLRETKEANKK